MASIICTKEDSSFPDTPWQLYTSLSSGRFVPDHIWLPRHFRLKFMLRAMILPFKTYRILKMLIQHPLYNELMRAQPRLPCRVHRPYLSTVLNDSERVNAIIYHHELHASSMSKDRLTSHLSLEGLTISSFIGKNETRFYLKYISTHRLDREGEASIILYSQSHQMLSEITFTLCKRNLKNSLIIGGLQGPNNEKSQETINQATKDLYGMFPKRIVLEALTSLANQLKTKKIYAVSNKSHVYKAARYKDKIKQIHSDYDSFWEMSGGFVEEEGLFTLPRFIARKSLDEIASKKRSEYRRRFELLDDIDLQIKDIFSTNPVT